MSSDAAHGRDDLPLEGEQQESSGAVDGGGGLWANGHDDPFADTTDWFSAELENVSASDWDIDAAQLWGDDGSSAGAEDAAEGGLDFTL